MGRAKGRRGAPRRGWLTWRLAAAASAGPVAGALGAPVLTASVAMADLNGRPVGTVQLTSSSNGVVFRVELRDLPPGVHGFHIHAAGVCAPPFASAGGHFNPDSTDHGFLNEDGPHAGDLANITVGNDGRAVAEMFSPLVTLSPDAQGSLVDGAKTSFVLTEGPDDYRTNPDGRSGRRIACGAVR